MRIGILSDTHNDYASTRTALALLAARGIDRLIHCGDVTSPELLAELFGGWQVALAYGNMDHDRAGLAQALAKHSAGSQIGLVIELFLSGLRIGVCHGHDQEVLATMIQSGRHDLICHGHLHTRRDQRIGRTRVVCPGALGGNPKEPRSLCVLDLTTQTVEFVHAS